MPEVHPRTVLQGSGVVAGVAYARAVRARPRPTPPPLGGVLPEQLREAEQDRFLNSADAVAEHLHERAGQAEGPAAAVLRATAAMVTDRGWRKAVRQAIGEGHPAEQATVRATDLFIHRFEAAGGVVAERIVDLRDIRDRVLAHLRGEEEPGPLLTGEPVVLLAEDLSPADTAALDPGQVVALVTGLGGPTGHTAIIARQLNLPCIVAVGERWREIAVGSMVLIDGAAGTVTLDPEAGHARELVERSRVRASRLARWRGPARTADGHRVELLANVADGPAAQVAAQSQAEGIGLYRTELSFLSATREPTVAEQARVYRRVLDAFPAARVIIRTLDAGSDKPLAWADPGVEANPALGMRGLRASRGDEGLLLRQLDAIAAASEGRGATAPTWVMAPMVSTVAEAAWFAQRCRERDLLPGAMIEVPAAALMADLLLPHLDFVSVGTNDLAQYTMAADRLSPHLSRLTDQWQPAVLRLIQRVCEAGEQAGVPVGVCGEAAADPLLACVLTGLGVASLSTAAVAVAGVGTQLAEVSLAFCRELAQAALMAPGAGEARAAVAGMLGQ